MDIVDIYTRERANTKCKFYKLTNLTFFASLLKDVPMACKDTVLPEPLLNNHNVNCLTFERNTSQPYNDNLCLFRALALHLHGDKILEEETSKFFNLFLNNSVERDPSKFQGAHMTDIPKVEEMLQLNIFLYDIDFVDVELIGELARRSIQKFEKSVKLLRYNNHICYVNNINALFKAFRCTTCDTLFSKTGNLEPHLVTCTDRFKHIYPKNVYELRQRKSQMKLNFIEVETAIKIKLCAILEQLNQRRNGAESVSNFVDDCMVEEEEKDLSTQFLQMQKNQLIDLKEHFERYCNVLPVFGFNSAKYDINLIKSYLLPILVNE